MWLSCMSIGAVTRFGLKFSEFGDFIDRPVVENSFGAPAFVVKDILGRRGSSTLDRNGALALMAAQECLDGVEVDPMRTGVVVGTTVGSFKSTSDFSGLTMTEEKPYNVPPSLFPNTVMNSAAGLTAIRHGLKGPNTTIAGSERAGLKSLRYLTTLFSAGYLDAAVLICVEEASEHRDTMHRTRGESDCGEAAVAMLLIPGSQPDRLLQMRIVDNHDEIGIDTRPDKGTTVLAVGPASSVVAWDTQRMFGSVGAATFGCQILTASALLGRGSSTVVLSAAHDRPAQCPATLCEVAR